MGRKMVATPLRWSVWERDDFTCRYCGSRQRLTIDHIVPVAQGGPDTSENLQTLCSTCNSRKWIKPDSIPDPSSLIEAQAAAEEARTLMRDRDDAIRAAHAEGHSLRKIAAATGLSFQRVHQIVKAG